MHSLVGHKKLVLHAIQATVSELADPRVDTLASIRLVLGTADAGAIKAEMETLNQSLRTALRAAESEADHFDTHYVSRIDAMGLFQSALAKVFADIPELQGLGDGNAIWILAKIDEAINDLKSFFGRVYRDVHNNDKLLIPSIVHELLANRRADTRSPFPVGRPATIPLPDREFTIAILADWGGDNPAARSVGQTAFKQKPDIAIHLGDIYYGGTSLECSRFVEVWPWSVRHEDGSISPPPNTSYSLNGNHEMFSGGEWYFKTVLPAFGQSHSFFCLEGTHWRVIGVDTAYAGGRLKADPPDESISEQWEWLKDLLSIEDGKSNILLSHHQPVSAHGPEYTDSAPLRADVEELLNSLPPKQINSIFGWFFGHEHRCIVYEDGELPRFNARLIGNGCVPHTIHEIDEVPGAAKPLEVNHKETSEGSGAAISSFALLHFGGPEVDIEYINEDNSTWGTEMWDATKGRLNGTKFVQEDGLQGQLK